MNTAFKTDSHGSLILEIQGDSLFLILRVENSPGIVKSQAKEENISEGAVNMLWEVSSPRTENYTYYLVPWNCLGVLFFWKRL